MPPTPKEEMHYRILEIELYVALMRELPKDKAWVDHYIPILEEAVARLKTTYIDVLRAGCSR